jgi:hypothetical protein
VAEDEAKDRFKKFDPDEAKQALVSVTFLTYLICFNLDCTEKGEKFR